MIIITCRNFPRDRKRSIKCFKNQYIESIEYLDNEYDDILIKENLGNDICYFNLNGESHNPAGPAVIYKNWNGDGIDMHVFYRNSIRMHSIEV